MSSQQKTAHVTGLNFPQANRLPTPGAAFSIPGGGAPGVLGNLLSGFTVAVAVHISPQEGNDIWDNGAGNDQLAPASEFVCGTFPETDAGQGWGIAVSGGNTLLSTFGSSTPASIGIEGLDQIALFSYIPDASLYDSTWLAQNVIQCACNGEFIRSSFGRDQNFAFPAVDGHFAIGGISPLSEPTYDASPPENVGGCVRSGISGVWMTPNVPTLEQARSFMEESMEAGRIVPRPFNPVRTVAGVATTPPSSPQGYHWDAADLPSELALGTPWVDKISGLELQLIGNQLGGADVYALDPQYYLNPLIQQG